MIRATVWPCNSPCGWRREPERAGLPIGGAGLAKSHHAQKPSNPLPGGSGTYQGRETLEQEHQHEVWSTIVKLWARPHRKVQSEVLVLYSAGRPKSRRSGRDVAK